MLSHTHNNNRALSWTSKPIDLSEDLLKLDVHILHLFEVFSISIEYLAKFDQIPVTLWVQEETSMSAIG